MWHVFHSRSTVSESFFMQVCPDLVYEFVRSAHLQSELCSVNETKSFAHRALFLLSFFSYVYFLMTYDILAFFVASQAYEGGRKQDQ